MLLEVMMLFAAVTCNYREKTSKSSSVGWPSSRYFADLRVIFWLFLTFSGGNPTVERTLFSIVTFPSKVLNSHMVIKPLSFEPGICTPLMVSSYSP